GKYATVCRAVHRKTRTPFAAKFVRKRRRNQDQMKEIIHEIAVLMQCSSTSRVIRLHEVYESATEMLFENGSRPKTPGVMNGKPCWVRLGIFLEKPHNFPISRGKYATVCRAVHRKTRTPFAAKFVRKRRRNQDQMKEIIHEIAVLMQCSSTSRVIRLHEVYESATEMVSVHDLVQTLATA
ncbi:hypothetical protein YQE_12570, partial [Dendroctonus ponderosae]